MKKLILLFCMVILLVGTISAFEFDNVKSYDEATKTILVKNVFGLGKDIATIKLNTPLNYKVPRGYQKVAEFEVSSFDNYNNAFKELELFDRKARMKKFTRDYDFKVKSYETNIVNDYDYVFVGVASNGSALYENKVIGTHEEQKEIWTKLNNTNFKDNDVKIIGIFTIVEEGDRIEWVPNFFGVRISEWAVWTESLNTGLVAYWKLDESSGTNATDSFGANHGTTTGATVNVEGKINTSYSFDGSGDHVSVPDVALLDMTEAVSISAWMNTTATGNVGTIVDKSNDGAESFLLREWDSAGSKIQFLINRGGTGSGAVAQTPFAVVNDFVHIVGTYDKTTIRLYINGTSVANTSFSDSIIANARPLGIGEQIDSGFGDFSGFIDEVAIWNRSISVAEVQQIYNNNSGIGFRKVFTTPPTITLIAPVDTGNFTATNVTFNATVTDNVEVSEVILFIDSTVNNTNTSLINGTYIFNLDFSEGTHNWSIGATDDENTTANSSVRTFTIDTIDPLLNLTAPIGTLNFGSLTLNETLNWTVTDTNLDSCFFDYNFTNISVTCGDNTTTFILTDQRNLTFYANDTFGHLVSNFTTWSYKIFENNQTFNNQTIEGSSEIFSINYNVDPSFTVTIANLSYNNTENIGSITDNGGGNFVATETISIPQVTADTNITFFWTFTLSSGDPVNSLSNNQTILNLAVDNCTTNTNLLFNYTMVDEENQTILTNTTLEIDLNILSLDRLSSILNFSELYDNINPSTVCMNINLTNDTKYSIDSIVRYEALDHVNEYYNIQNFTLENGSIPQNITLFDLLSADSTEFQITFKDNNFVVVENALIEINRNYIAEGVFKTVEIPKTDSNGQTVAHLVEKEIIYNMIVTKNGVILGTFNNLIAFCDDVTIGSCFITLNALQSNEPAFDYDSEIGLASSFDYNETSRLLSFAFTTTGGSVKNVTLTAVKFDQLGNESVCGISLVSSSGTLTCTVPASVGNETIIVNILVNGDLKLINYISAGTEFDTGTAGVFLALLLVLSLSLMFLESKSGVILGVVIGLISAVSLFLLKGGIMGVGTSVLWLIITAFILLWKLNKEGQT